MELPHHFLTTSDEHAPPVRRRAAAAAVEHAVFRSESGSDGASAYVWQCEPMSAIRQHAADQPASLDLVERFTAIVELSVLPDDHLAVCASAADLHHCAAT